MSVDFTPVFGEYKPTGSFRFWCQKVLPLVYDDSLSYYELLCKVVKYLNDVIQNVDTLNDNVDAVKTAYELLQNYVNDYFASLDVQNEINEKLDDMASDGSLAVVVNPIIAEEVSTWLASHITPTSPAVDTSMTVSGAAADAAAVGTLFGRTVTFRTELTGGENLDDMATAGFWYKQYNVPVTNGVNDNPAKIIAFSRPLAGSIGASQLWFDVATNKLYYRTRRTEEDAWGSWTLLADDSETVTFRSQLTAGQDMDNILQAGYYYKVGSVNVANVPNDRQAKFLCLSRPSAGRVGAVQLWFDVNKNKMLFRTNLSATSNWGQWEECVSVRTKNNTHATCYARFVTEMQNIANSLGVSNNTVITSPNGNYNTMSTANDMMRILLYAYSFEEIRRIWNRPTYSFKTISNEPQLKELTSTLFNENYTVNCPIIGGKPGIIGATDTHGLVANLCMMALLEPDNVDSRVGACVVMGATSDNNRFLAMNKLMTAMKNNTPFNPDNYSSLYISAVYPYKNVVGCNNSSAFPLGIQYANKDGDTQFPTASTVKLLTAITVLTHISDIDAPVTICPNDITTGSGNIFSSGDVVKVRDLLYSLIMISSNTAAVALAHYVGDWLLNHE